MPNVKCSVDNCEYWGRGGVCNADTISVNKAPSASTEFADEPGSIADRDRPAGETGAAPADDSRRTCCGTMRRRREGAVGERRGPRMGPCRP
ncbi:MAG: DUF1540 domain-containing protein [Bacillota bacterium]